MNLVYHSTRNSEETATASEAILKGLTSDGGLFVPDSIPKLNVSLEDLTKMSYQEIAYAVMKEFLTDFTEEELRHCINSAYDSKFDTEVIAPLVKVGDTYHLELFHDGAEGQGGQIGQRAHDEDDPEQQEAEGRPFHGEGRIRNRTLLARGEGTRHHEH